MILCWSNIDNIGPSGPFKKEKNLIVFGYSRNTLFSPQIFPVAHVVDFFWD